MMSSYLRFNVLGLAGQVTGATLRIYSNSGSSIGYQVRTLANPTSTWVENTITYANAPAASTTVTGQSGALTAGTWSSVDISPLVTGNGTVDLVLTTSSGTQINLASRESGATAPQLIVTTN